MGHSPNYQTDLQIRELELVAQILAEQGLKLKDAGYEALANAAFDQAEHLEHVFGEFSRQMSRPL